MPTFNRRQFVPRAIQYFLRQDYANKELVIIDDGTDRVADLIPLDSRIRYFGLPRSASTGAKRNLACKESKGTLIAHWDDDDWYAPWRLTYQVEQLLETDADICGLDRVLFYSPEDEKAWEYVYPPDQRAWVYGASLCYTRRFFETHPFADVRVGEDHVSCGLIHGHGCMLSEISGLWSRSCMATILVRNKPPIPGTGREPSAMSRYCSTRTFHFTLHCGLVPRLDQHRPNRRIAERSSPRRGVLATFYV